MEDTNKERNILMVMRKTLAAIIKDTTPAPGTISPLTTRTIEDIRMCLALIANRERELAAAQGIKMEKPFFTDERPNAEVVPIVKIRPSNPSQD
ncbi:segregation and condensation protein A [Achromatium sp. WMS2]|nr:segregation and condensation protein A [Achromatium sp. WMS2]